MDQATTFSDYQMMTPEDLGILLGRSPKRIRVDVTQRPETLPPRWIPPGCAGRQRLKPQWRVVDVRAWLDRAAAELKARQEEVDRTARKAGLDPADIPRKGVHLGHQSLGAAANERL